MSVTHSELHALSLLGDRVEHLESFFSSSYVAKLRTGFLNAVEKTSLLHLKGTESVDWLPPMKVINATFEKKKQQVKQEIEQVTQQLQSKQRDAKKALEERLQLASDRYDAFLFYSITVWTVFSLWYIVVHFLIFAENCSFLFVVFVRRFF